ncbi:MAG: DUF86 domain-containing protein [Desulfobacterales bacterium]|nr:DUF86 domain-containing protein [Desulfobacterales bacterium]
MDERIKEHLKHLHRYLLLLEDARKIPFEKFQKDLISRGSAERYLHLAIESCLNIGNRLLAVSQLEKPVKPPETYADIFKELYHLGVLEDWGFMERLMQMAKFRNRLVHLYWELDEHAVYEILQKHLTDLHLFKQTVVDYMNHRGEN